jgi:hypothetical protein
VGGDEAVVGRPPRPGRAILAGLSASGNNASRMPWQVW